MELDGLERQGKSYYDKRLLILIFLSSLPNAFITLQSIAVQYQPPYRCDISVLPFHANSDSLKNWNETDLNATIPWVLDSSGKIVRSSCTMYNITPVHLSGLSLSQVNKSDIVPCTNYYFDGVEKSATTEFEMVCQQAWIQKIMISIYFTGGLVFSLIGSYISDRCGRKPVFLIFTFLQFATSIAASFSDSLITYGSTMFLSGGANMINFMTTVVLGTEMLSQNNRYHSYFLAEIGFSVGYLLMPLLAFLLRDWRWYLRSIGFMGVLYIPYFWLIDESPKWLLATGNFKGAKKVQEKVRKLNGESPGVKLVADCDEVVATKSNVWKTLKGMMEHPVLIWRLVIITFGWFVVNVLYYAIALNTNSLSGDRFLNVFYAGIAEFVATLLYFLVVSKWGCKNCYCITMCIASIMLLLTPLFAKWNSILVIIATMMCKLCSSICFNLLYVYTTLLFPTCARNLAVGISNSGGRIGSIVSPYVMYSGGMDSSTIPIIVVGVIALCSTGIIFFVLPNSKQEDLPQTVEDALALKRDFNYCGQRIVLNGAKTRIENDPIDGPSKSSTEKQTLVA
uniref:organic cation transporter protein-like n=1 Tax=Ciona intestinalis TaxID=7719 RepID=UPI00089DAEAD|nr:organic cation transporter protein-like [Ciona intestinalis]|eukprot:XP_018668289.1 organic cation transporter protein-like [Ciona intestinalis]